MKLKSSASLHFWQCRLTAKKAMLHIAKPLKRAENVIAINQDKEKNKIKIEQFKHVVRPPQKKKKNH